MDNRIFSERIRNLRKNKGMSQELLSEKLGISVQAVSKWECAQSYPDIELLPVIADIMEVSIDYLLRGSEAVKAGSDLSAIENTDNNTGVNCRIGEKFELPDDNVLRIIQFKGRTLLGKNNYDPKVKIPLYIEDCLCDVGNVEIWGSADIKGDIAGNVTSGGGVNCRDVDGYIDAGGGVNCGDVGGDVKACGNVECEDIEGDVVAGSNVKLACNIIEGDVQIMSGELHCSEISGDVDCGGAIYYDK